MSRVLVIDDSEFIRSFVSDVLTDAGYEVIAAENGTEGLREFEKAVPDCILLDVLMPDIDGLEVLKEIRKKSEALPILLMTGDDPGWARRTAQSYGATGFLSKALYADKLLEAVEEVILSSET